MKLTKEKEKDSFSVLKDRFGYKSTLASPRLVKVVVGSGTGKRAASDKKYNELVEKRLAALTSQKPSARAAKKSIASFKLREGETVGYAVTLRKRRMYDFLDRFFNVAVPRMRDFRGFSKKSIDEMGNATFGIKEHNIFPEAAQEEVKDVFGLAVTIATTARNRKEAEAFFEAIGVPFKKDEELPKKKGGRKK